MFVVKKILAGFLIPPGLFVTLLAGAAIYLFLKKKSRKLAIYLAVVAILVWVLSVTPVADGLTRSLEKAIPQPRAPQGDVVIVLYGTGQRLNPALMLENTLRLPLVLCGFNYLENNPQEKEHLLASLEQFGIPRDKIVIETRSRDTKENIEAAKLICRERGYRRPIVVTSAFHGRRVKLTCRKQDFPALLVPVSYSVFGRAIHYTWRDYLPLAENLYTTSIAMNEYLGLVFYGLFY